MIFRTEIKLERPHYTLSHDDRMFAIGSCFSENISRRLGASKFPITANPTGILFNPRSIYNALTRLSSSPVELLTEEDIQTDGNLWFNWNFHGSFSETDSSSALQNINAAITTGSRALKEARVVMITFGTAWVYELRSTGKVVANCHKQPQTLFDYKRLSTEEIVDDFSILLEGPLAGRKVIFTLSPVRHLKDGFAGNSLSKAILRIAIGELVEKYDNAVYFPAYEIVNDDLRDYRFYAEDMIHPSPQAIDYIWESFMGWSMNERTISLISQIEKLNKALSHRVKNTRSKVNDEFRAKMIGHITALQSELPQVDFSAELEYFKV